MTIRMQTILAIVLTFLSIILILLFVSRVILSQNLSKLEAENAHLNMERVLNAVDYTVSDLEAIAVDWASWDDTYLFVENRNDHYIENNLVDSTFISLRLNVMLFISDSGEIVYGKAFNLDTNEEIAVPADLRNDLSPGSPLLSSPGLERLLSGLLFLRDHPPLLTISRPILDSNDEGPVHGTFILGRYLDTREIDRFGQLTSLSLSSFNLKDDVEVPPDIQTIYYRLLGDDHIVTEPINSQYIDGYVLINDIYGDPGLIITAEMPRDIYQEGQLAITYLILVITTVVVFFGIIAVFSAEKQGLSRLRTLARTVEGIARSGKVSSRVYATGKDEISSLATNINQMLASLQHSENILRERAEHLQTAVIEAQLANQAKTEFLSSVSHELRTPLTAIIGLAQLLQKKYYGVLNDKQTEYVDDILESSNHLLSLINDILDLAKIEAGKSKLELAEVQIRELISSSILLVKENAVNKGINIRIDIPDEILNQSITVDKRRFRQIMVNLLSNAIKFTGNGGKVTIDVEIRRDVVEVSVSDTGVGISPEEQPRIFDAFYQVYSGTTGKSPGTGLGLSLAKRLVEQHNGQIWVESDGVGKGSRFTFSISLKLSKQEPADHKPAAENIPKTKKVTNKRNSVPST